MALNRSHPIALDRILITLFSLLRKLALLSSNKAATPWHKRSVKLEVICPAGSVDKVVALIAQAAKTGTPGDGIIAIQSVEQVMKIRDM